MAKNQPYRESTIYPICAVCGEPAGVECPRCGAALCRTHLLEVGTRCPTCEDHFQHLEKDRKANPLRTYQVFLSYLAGGLFLWIGIGIVELFLPARLSWVESFENTRLLALAGVALLACLFPLFGMLYRRRRLRPKFLSERPDRRRLRLRVKKPRGRSAPSDELSVGAFCLSLMFFVPLVPLVGGLLGFAVIATRRCREHQRLVRLGFAAAPLGLLIALGQFVYLGLALV